MIAIPATVGMSPAHQLHRAAEHEAAVGPLCEQLQRPHLWHHPLQRVQDQVVVVAGQVADERVLGEERRTEQRDVEPVRHGRCQRELGAQPDDLERDPVRLDQLGVHGPAVTSVTSAAIEPSDVVRHDSGRR